MGFGVAPPRAQDRARTARRTGGRQSRCQTRPGQVEQIVQARSGPTEPLVPGAAMADHGIERVDGPVGQQAGNPGDRTPKKRCNDRVGSVLRHRLDHGTGHLDSVQRTGVPTHQGPESSPGTGKVLLLQQHPYSGRLPFQGTTTEHDPGGHRRDGRSSDRGTGGDPLCDDPQPGGRTHEEHHVGDTACP